MLQKLLYEDRKLLDGWDKQTAIYCTEDWPCFYYRQQEATIRSRTRDSSLVKSVFPLVHKAIEERGPLSSIDLDHDQKVDWHWGPTRLAKVALDSMYYLGELVIHHKVHTRKVYDLASRHIPEELLLEPDPHVTQEQYHDWHVLRRIGSVGLLWNKGSVWAGIYGAGSKERAAAITRLMRQGKAVEVRVEGVKTPLYMRSQDLTELDIVMESDGPTPRTAILAPLDNLLWERDLVGQLFGFDYTWEVYKPVTERRYGYYVLPILYGDRFIARFEPGRDKKSGALIIKNWWWEPGISRSEKTHIDLQQCLKQFLKYLGTDNLRIDSKLVEEEGLAWLTLGNN